MRACDMASSGSESEEDPLAHIEREVDLSVYEMQPPRAPARELSCEQIAAEERQKKRELRQEQLEMRDRVKREETRKAFERERCFQRRQRERRAERSGRQWDARGSVAPRTTVPMERALAVRSGDDTAIGPVHAAASGRHPPECRSQDVRSAKSHSEDGVRQPIGRRVDGGSAFYKRRETSYGRGYELQSRDSEQSGHRRADDRRSDGRRKYRDDYPSHYEREAVWSTSMYHLTDERRQMEEQMKGREICINFNRSHNCPNADKCHRRHVCEVCFSLKHGAKWRDGCTPFVPRSERRPQIESHKMRFEKYEPFGDSHQRRFDHYKAGQKQFRYNSADSYGAHGTFLGFESEEEYQSGSHSRSEDSRVVVSRALVPPSDFRKSHEKAVGSHGIDKVVPKTREETTDEYASERAIGRRQQEYCGDEVVVGSGVMHRELSDRTLHYGTSAHPMRVGMDDRRALGCCHHYCDEDYYGRRHYDSDDRKVPPTDTRTAEEKLWAKRTGVKGSEERSEHLSDEKLMPVPMARFKAHSRSSSPVTLRREVDGGSVSLPTDGRMLYESKTHKRMTAMKTVQIGKGKFDDLRFLYCLSAAKRKSYASSRQPVAVSLRAIGKLQCEVQRETDELWEAHQSGKRQLECFHSSLLRLVEKVQFLKEVLESQFSEQMHISEQRMKCVCSPLCEERVLRGAKQLQAQMRRTAKERTFTIDALLNAATCTQRMTDSVLAAFAPLQPTVVADSVIIDCGLLEFDYELDTRIAVDSLEAVIQVESSGRWLHQTQRSGEGPIGRIAVDLSSVLAQTSARIRLRLAASNKFGQSDWFSIPLYID